MCDHTLMFRVRERSADNRATDKGRESITGRETWEAITAPGM